MVTRSAASRSGPTTVTRTDASADRPSDLRADFCDTAPAVLAVLKIILDVARFRLARLEMANLAAAGALMLTFRLPAGELTGRVAFGLLLNLLVYLNNDFHDLGDDLASGSRDAEKTRFLRDHVGAAIVAQLVLLAALVGIALVWQTELLVALVLGGGICWAYSYKLKRVPGLDVLAMTLWGVSMPLIGFPLPLAVGWLLVVQLGLFSTLFESIQVLRDRAEDAAQDARTTAVLLGDVAMRRVIRAAHLLAAGFAALCLSPLAALVIAAGSLIPIDADVPRYWNRVRLLCGVAFLIECATIYLSGHTHGLWLQLSVDTRLWGAP